MITIPIQQVVDALPPATRRNNLVSALDFAVPDLAWWSRDWVTYWRAHRRHWQLNYEPGSGMCDEFAALAVASGIRAGRTQLRNADERIAMWEVRVRIARGTALHGVTDGAHALCLIAYEDDDRTPTFALLEPQRDGWERAHTTLDRLPRGVEIADIWL